MAVPNPTGDELGNAPGAAFYRPTPGVVGRDGASPVKGSSPSSVTSGSMTSDAPPSVPSGPVLKVVFLVNDTKQQTRSYTWRAWSARGDFYIKPRFDALSAFKVSLHGPQPDKGLVGSRWKIAVDDRDAAAASRAGGVFWHGGSDRFVHDFSGVKVAPKVHHVVRVRNAWRTLYRGSPSGPNPGPAKQPASSTHAALRPPPPLHCVDVDFYLSETGFPYWPAARCTAAAGAQIGWLTNDAGQQLTMVSWGHSIVAFPTPETLQLGPRPVSKADSMRAIATGIDGDGLLWIEETLISRNAALNGAEFPGPHASE